MMTVEQLETGLLALLKGTHSSLTLSFNDESGPSYRTVKEVVADDIDRDWVRDWVSDEEKQKAIDTNRMWTLHWYPDTPVGFISLSASSLPVLIDAALKSHCTPGERG